MNKEELYFAEIIKNEIETKDWLLKEQKYGYEDNGYAKVYYISDIHLPQKIEKGLFMTDKIEKMADSLLARISLLDSGNKIILIGGDVSCELSIFKDFVKCLKKKIRIKKQEFKNGEGKYYPGLLGYSATIKVVFVLGNHEFWPFKWKKTSEIIEQYRKILNKAGMFLLDNSLIFFEEEKAIELSSDQIERLSATEILDCAKKAKEIIFGGTGFSGYNKKFNAEIGMYKNAINRDEEIEESLKFEKLYKKICEVFYERKTIILTHMPPNDWCSNVEYNRNFVYVYGHTHKNYFFDDGEKRIYTDNQLGYKSQAWFLKYFYIDNRSDIFNLYEDGIYEITRSEYCDFWRYKNELINFNSELSKLYMLKKEGYYMFVKESDKGDLFILNKGASKKLLRKDITYYFSKMAEQVESIREIMAGYTERQEKIGKEVKKIGGSGKIHGAIIDIDFFNHIYLDPFGGKVTPYFATDMKNKEIYKNVEMLLLDKTPKLFANYQKLITAGEKKELPIAKEPIEKEIYLSTDIYKVSNIVKKMQNLNENIKVLTLWIEKTPKKIES